MKKFLFLVLCSFFLSTSCEEEDRTIFIADENDSHLPAYSEWGYNSFGAIYERSYFLVSSGITPCKITYQHGFLNFYLIGKVHLGSSTEMVLTFSFPSLPMNNYADLVQLNKTTIDLLDTSCTVKIEVDGIEEIITPLSGSLTFKRTQLLKIDGEQNRVIISGIFDMTFLRKGRPEKISKGRFDIGINSDFYVFPEETK